MSKVYEYADKLAMKRYDKDYDMLNATQRKVIQRDFDLKASPLTKKQKLMIKRLRNGPIYVHGGNILTARALKKKGFVAFHKKLGLVVLKPKHNKV